MIANIGPEQGSTSVAACGRAAVKVAETMRVLPLILIVAASAQSALAQAPAQQTLAIASIEARNGASAGQASEVNDAVTAALVGDGRLRVVERQQIAKVMKEQALSMSGAVSDDSQVKVAQLVGARFIATGSVQPSGRSLSLSLQAMDSSSAQVVFADSVTLGTTSQLQAGAKQLALKMADKIAGGTAAAGSTEIVGDFDNAQVKDSARSLARSLAMRFPKLSGQVVESIPDGSLTCSFSGAQPFPGQFFEIDGKDEVTGQMSRKGFFLLKSTAAGGCSGKAKNDPGAAITRGDQLIGMPLKINVESLEPGPGAQPELAKLLADEIRAALDTVPNFRVASDPQLTAIGRVSGPRGRRNVELQLVDKGGNIVQKVDLPAAF
jgi:TolB-like protein